MTQFTITYKKTDGKTDEMIVSDHNIIEAVKEFEAIQRESNDYGIAYTRHAIVNIQAGHSW